jgi:transposase
MFSYVSLARRVSADHPLHEVRKLADTVLAALSRELDALYAEGGRPSIAPEYILRALLLQVIFSVRSERLLVEQIDYNLLFRCFPVSWAWAWMMGRGTMRCFRRAATGC